MVTEKAKKHMEIMDIERLMKNVKLKIRFTLSARFKIFLWYMMRDLNCSLAEGCFASMASSCLANPSK